MVATIKKPDFRRNDVATSRLDAAIASRDERPMPDADDYQGGERPDANKRFILLTGDDLRQLPALEWCVHGVLPATGVVALYGASGSGKSFLALDLAAHIPDGTDWFGRRVKQHPTVMLALEGEGGIRGRADAWERAHDRKLPDGLRLVLQNFNLVGDVPELAAAILAAVGPGAVVFIDTLNRAAPLADENSSRDMGEILAAAKALQRLTAGLIILVHHCGKDAARGLRGHSSLFAAMDAAVEVVRDGTRREWKVAKSKDGADGAAFPFRLDLVELEPDEEGDPVTSCVIRPDETPQDATRSRLPRGGNQKVVLEALSDLLRKSATTGKARAPAHRPCVETEAAVEAISSRLTCEPLRRKERTRQALTGLISSGVVMSGEGWLWLP